MGLNDEFSKYLFDSRMVEKNIESGLITRAEYEAHLKSMEDSGSNAVEIQIKSEEKAPAPEPTPQVDYGEASTPANGVGGNWEPNGSGNSGSNW